MPPAGFVKSHGRMPGCRRRRPRLSCGRAGRHV